jgi:hypothetical protein
VRHYMVRSIVAGSSLVLSGAGVVAHVSPASAAPLNRCAPTENGAPVLDSLSLGPQLVDARTASQQVQITAQAHDTGGPGPATGIGRFEVRLSDGRTVLMRYTGGNGWVGTIVVPRWSKGGTLSVSGVSLQDNAHFPDQRVLEEDEGIVFDRTYSGADLASVSGDRSIDVLTVEDPDPPRITDVNLYPRAVDTRKRSKSVYVTARAFDGGSGVRDARASFSQGTGFGLGEFRRTVHMRVLPGRHGLLRGRLVVPRRIGNRPAKLTVLVRDNAGKRRQLTPTQLLDRGLPHALRIRSRALPPAGRTRIRGATASTSSVDVRTADRAVTWRIRITNKRGRVAKVRFAMFPYRQNHSGRPRLVSGNRHDGIWRVRAVVDSCLAASGTFRPGVVAEDRNRIHQRELRGLTVLAADRATPEELGADVDGNGRITVLFSEAVNGVDNESMPVRAVATGQPVPGHWICNPAGPTTSCATGSFTTASFAPDAPLDSGVAYQVLVNPSGSLGVTDLAGNPAHRGGFQVTAP